MSRFASPAGVERVVQTARSSAWAGARKGLSVDICPLVAVSLARWGHATRAHLHNRGPGIYL